MHVISIVNQKGGVGKTTLTLNLAALLHKRGYRVLAVDLDAQANLTLYAGIDPVTVQNTHEGMKAVFLGEKPIADVVMSTAGGFDVAPSCLSFASVELGLQARPDPNGVLRAALRRISTAYDFVLLDNAPMLGRTVINSLAASDTVLIPAKTDLFSLSGLAFVRQTIEAVQESVRPQLRVLGIIPNFFHSRQVADRTALEELNRHAAGLRMRVFTPIRTQTDVVKSTFATASMIDQFPASQFSQGVAEIADALILSSVPATTTERNIA